MGSRCGGWKAVVGAVGVHDGGDDRIEIGGWIAQQMGYSSAFLILGSIAVISIALWIFNSKTMKKECAPSEACQ